MLLTNTTTLHFYKCLFLFKCIQLHKHFSNLHAHLYFHCFYINFQLSMLLDVFPLYILNNRKLSICGKVLLVNTNITKNCTCNAIATCWSLKNKTFSFQAYVQKYNVKKITISPDFCMTCKTGLNSQSKSTWSPDVDPFQQSSWSTPVTRYEYLWHRRSETWSCWGTGHKTWILSAPCLAWWLLGPGWGNVWRCRCSAKGIHKLDAANKGGGTDLHLWNMF